jgi:hypothetical protein
MYSIQGKISLEPTRLPGEDDERRATRIVHMIELRREWAVTDGEYSSSTPQYPSLDVSAWGYSHLKTSIWKALVELLAEHVWGDIFSKYTRFQLTRDQLKRVCGYMAKIESNTIDVRFDVKSIDRELGYYLDMSLYRCGYVVSVREDIYEKLKVRLKKYL